MARSQAFRESSAENKVNLVIGAYRGNDGMPYVLPSVRAAEAQLLTRGEKKEYAPIEGLPAFVDLALKFACAPLPHHFNTRLPSP